MDENTTIEKPPEFFVASEEQEAFAEFWGADFQSVRIGHWGISASEDGTMIGLYLQTHFEGKTLRASFNIEEIALFQAMLCGAVTTAIDRMQAMANGKKGN
jgi:hypothetical protein